MNVQSTKAIARKVGFEVAAVNELARDLKIEMTYRADNRYWEIADIKVAKQFLAYIESTIETIDEYEDEEQQMAYALHGNRHLV